MKARHPWGRLTALVCALAALPLVAEAATQPAGAEKAAAVELPQPLTREAIRELVARLSDAEVRELLLAQLDKAAGPAEGGSGEPMATDLASDMDRARTDFGAVLRSWSTLPAALGDAVRRFSEGRGSYHLLLVGVLFAGLLALGWIAERVVRRLLGDVRARLDRGEGRGPGADAGSLVIRAVLELLLLAVFTFTAFAGFLALYQGHGPSRELVVGALIAAVQVRLAILIARFLLAPHAPAQRLLPFDDGTAGILYRGVVGLAWLFGILDVVAFFLQRFGMPREPFILVIISAGSCSPRCSSAWSGAFGVRSRPRSGATDRAPSAACWPTSGPP